MKAFDHRLSSLYDLATVKAEQGNPFARFMRRWLERIIWGR